MTAMKTAGKRGHVVRVRVNEDEQAFLMKTARAEERTVSSVLRVALREFRDKREGKTT